jgi:muramoyltetrapeptide carboxypeptidase
MLASLPHLEEGSIVDIVAPASACERSELKGAIQFVKSLGLKARVSPKIFHGQTRILAATDEERFGQLKAALLAKDSAAIWCIRGGYGSIRLLPELAKLKRPSRPKLFLGYSDITTLHIFLNQVWKWPTIHSPMVGRFGRGDATAKELKDVKSILFGPFENFKHELTPLNKAAKQSGVIRSSVIGGNLITLQSSLGTPWSFRPDGKILLFEDLGEKPHRLDRVFVQAEQAGWFKKAKAVVLGDFLYPVAVDRRMIWNDVIPRFAEGLKIPVFKDLPSGHGKVNRPIPFLTQATLKTGSSSKLEISLTPV